MSREQLLELHQRLTRECQEIMQAKNADYTGGGDVFANFRMTETLGIPAELGILIRMMDKIQRVRSFVVNGELKVKEESVTDALQDIINYAVLCAGVICDRSDSTVEEDAIECRNPDKGYLELGRLGCEMPDGLTTNSEPCGESSDGACGCTTDRVRTTSPA